jgi:hypothetical protein
VPGYARSSEAGGERDAGTMAGGQGPCSPCRPGFFAAATNASTCMPCPGGSYQSEAGATECVACPRGSNSTSGAAVRENCTCVEGELGPAGGPCGPLYRAAAGALDPRSLYTRPARSEWVVSGVQVAIPALAWRYKARGA